MVRISKIEMTGMKRTNRKNRVKKRPMVPMNVDQSHIVGWYMPHDEGRKSRCSEVTMMTNRSSHIPTFVNIAQMNRATALVRTFLIHRNCGEITLHTMRAQ